jgi:hypothetical protein
MLFSTPPCKAQEIVPNHFTETGVQDIYESAPIKVAASKGQQKLLNSQTNSHEPGTLQASTKRTRLLHVRSGNRTVAIERKPALSAVKKP